MSCLPFSVDILDDMEVAFEGTVRAVDADLLTLDVVTWYTGGDAEQVQITAPLGMEAFIGGIPFEVGGSYLVTASNGVVNYCGYTGVATPEFRARVRPGVLTDAPDRGPSSGPDLASKAPCATTRIPMPASAETAVHIPREHGTEPGSDLMEDRESLLRLELRPHGGEPPHRVLPRVEHGVDPVGRPIL